MKNLFILFFFFTIPFFSNAQYLTIGKIHPLDPELDAIIGTTAPIEILAQGFVWSESPVWVKKEEYLLFTDVPKNVIHKWSAAKGLEVFLTPPNAAKPRVWRHWMNGNITKEGIQKDLEWMQRTGIGGFQNFDANLFTPVVVPKKLVFMTPEWKDAFKFTTELAHKKGLEMAIAGSPGWSVTGGPWVEPKDGMKKYVWTETRVIGGQPFSGKLAQPSDATGVFQNVKVSSGGIMGGYVGAIPAFYQDAAVIAYRLPKNDQILKDLKPTLTSSGGNFNVDDLTDGNLSNTQFFHLK